VTWLLVQMTVSGDLLLDGLSRVLFVLFLSPIPGGDFYPGMIFIILIEF
jgi:hypothetical protein